MNKCLPQRQVACLLTYLLICCLCGKALANSPGGGTGSGPKVTVVDNGGGTVTLSNGIVSILIDTAAARLNGTTYTYDNNGAPVTSPVLQGPYGPGRGNYYWGGFSLGTGSFTYSLAVDPAKNGGNYADVKLFRTSPNKGEMEVHFSMLRGSPGYYSAATMTHRAQDDAFEVTAWGVVTRVPSTFNWITADGGRNYFVGIPKTAGKNMRDGPKESGITLDGSEAGEWENKFFTAQDHADQKAWGWSSVGKGGLNIGVWMMTNMDFSNGGPLKRDVGIYAQANLNNSILTGEVGQGSDGKLAAGELWTKTCGPFFTYYNNVPKSVADAKQAASALYSDALEQYKAEKGAWPYRWFADPAYVPAAGRGTVKGKLQIIDANNPDPLLAGTWVGVEQQPTTSTGTYDFQKWLKPYQYWTLTDAAGNFTIPNIIAGSKYTLYAFGPGAAGTLMSQELSGGNPPLLYDLPAKPFDLSVKAGATTDLGTVVWTNQRVGPTVFELGVPNRKTDEFRHGEDFWAPEKSPKLGFPTPVWGAQPYFPLDFPNGLTYTVGQSRWSTDWNFVLPSLPDASSSAGYHSHAGTINFNLPSAPAAGAQASLYLGCAGNWGSKIIVSVNGVQLDSKSGATGRPNAISTTGFGFNPPAGYSDNSSIHLSNHGPFFDERIDFPGSLLHGGTNSITLSIGVASFQAFLGIDYLRLELTGFKPAPPSSVTAYPGPGRNLVTWPVVPGAIRYNVLRSTTAGSGYGIIASGRVGTVSGEDASINTFTDTTAVNGTTYYYAVQSWNPSGGSSANSPPSAGTTPLEGGASSAPAAPAALSVVGSGHHSVALKWNAVPGACYYSVSRTTLYKDGVGGFNPLRTSILNDVVKATTFTDTTPTDGKTYRYFVQAISASGTSAASANVLATPLPPAPQSAPAGLMAKRNADPTKADLTWSPVAGATGYVIYRSKTPGTFTFPKEFVLTTPRTKMGDSGLIAGTGYYYQVNAVNSAGVSAGANASIP